MGLREYIYATGRQLEFNYLDKVEFLVSESNNLKTYGIGIIDVDLDLLNRENFAIVKTNNKNHLLSNLEYVKKIDHRPTWTQYFLNLCNEIKKRSHDAQTQHGCVITNKHHQIVSTGYNGFPPGVDDSKLPNTRPEKYPYILHAEENAILNSKCDLNNHLMYVSGKPCVPCLRRIMAVGISHVYYDATTPAFQAEASEREIFDHLLSISNVAMVRCV